ncbi:MAG TPA: alpha/beta hydrolase [Gaiellaceae bacterium]|nr:alpha/beta hydrolase [Gaiellaceae bacterium]
MRDDEVLAETRAFNQGLEQLVATLPPLHTVAPEETRRTRRESCGVFPPPVYLPDAWWERIPGRDGEIPVRLVEPEGESRGAYLHFHGGGWTIGAADLQDPSLKAAADATGLTMASVDYRLAPEHPYPAAPDDCEDAALWFLDRFSGRLALGGESAGAHLAVVTLVRLRDRQGVDVRSAFAAANLSFGPFDLTGTPSRFLWGGRELVLSDTTMSWFVENYVPSLSDAERRDPDVSPLYADLRDLPPALFTCGTLDPLLDDTLFMEARWRAAGNEATLSIVPDAVHGFVAFDIEAARRSRAQQYAFVGG